MTDIDTEIERLRQAFKHEVTVMNDVASKRQHELQRELNWSMEELRANTQVCKIRLEREIERLKQEGSEQEMKAGPVVRLPSELLSYIFRYHVDGGLSPWGLAKVCKDWMKTAFATLHIWRYICITGGGGQNPRKWVINGTKYYSRDNRQFCYTAAQLRDALQRPGVVPLDVHVNCPGTDPLVIHRVSYLLRILISTPISERIERLNIDELPSSDAVLPTDVQVGPFSQLNTIHLPRLIKPWAHSLLASIDSTSLQLQVVVLNTVVCQKLTTFSFWSRLRRLKCMQFGYTPQHGDLGQFDNLVEQLVNLEDISSPPDGWPNERTPILTWEHIKEINLKGDPKHLGRLMLPNVESLTFNDATSLIDLADDIPALSYPKLTTLVIHTHDPRSFSNLSAPALTNLTLIWSMDKPLSPTDGPIRISPNLLSHVTFIKLQTPMHAGDMAIVSALESAPNLRKIELPGRYGDNGFGLELLKRLDASQQPILCPELEFLSFGTDSASIYTLKKKALPLIKRVVTSRKKAGIPLREFLVNWRNIVIVENYAS